MRIILVDDHAMVREGLRSMLEKQSDVQIIAEANDGREAVTLTKEMSPDIVIMDVNLPNLNGIEATREIISECPQIKVVALSMYSDVRFLSRMIIAGASAYVLKDCAFEELNRAIHAVNANQIYLSQKMHKLMLNDYLNKSRENDKSSFSQLTSREREVLQLIAEGNSTKEIATRLCVSIKTVEAHRNKLMQKLLIYNVAGLTKYAIREGLTFSEP